MRFLCNFLVGLPLLGLFTGSIIFLVQSIQRFNEGPQQWAPCMNLLQWLLNKWNILQEMSAFTAMYCDFSPGAHLVIISILIGIVTIPLGLLLSRTLK